MRILKFFILTFAVFSHAITPSIKINIFAAHSKLNVETKDPFRSDANKPFYIEYDQLKTIDEPTKEDHMKKHDGKEFDGTKQHEDGKKSGFGQYAKHGIVFGGSIDVTIENNSYLFGANAGAMLFTAQPQLKASLHIPDKKEGKKVIEEEIKKIDSQLHATKANKKELEDKKASLEEWKKNIDNGSDAFFQDTPQVIKQSVTIKKGFVFFGGPTFGMFISDNIAIGVDLNLAATKTGVEINDGGKIRTEKFSMNVGFMPVLKLSWYATDKFAIFLSGGCIMFFDAKKLPANKFTAKQKDDKPKEPAKGAKAPSDNKDDFHGANKFTWFVAAGFTIQIQ